MKVKNISDSFEEAKAFLSNETFGPLDYCTQLIADNISEIIYKKERLERENRKLKSRMFVDSLTRITNRGKFDLLLKQQFKKWNDFSLLFFDIDHFKQVNDTYWHLSWDLVLKVISRKIKTKIKWKDVFARYWWEEFIIILPGTNLNWWEVFSERIRQLVEDLKIKDDAWRKIKVTISIWVVKCKKKDNVNSLLARADKALYQAKDSWRNQVVSIKK